MKTPYRSAAVVAVAALIISCLMVLLSLHTVNVSSAQPAPSFDEIAASIGRAEASYALHGFTETPPRYATQSVTTTLSAAQYLPIVIGGATAPAPMTERRVIWLTRYDWTTIDGRPADPAIIDEMVKTIADTGFNTIFFQIRGGGDAFYTPGLEPWSSRLTGTAWETLGEDPGWDPLARMLTKARDAGLEVHAYVNVYSIWAAPPDDSYGELWPPATTPPHMFDRFTYGPTYEEHPGEYALAYEWRQYDDTETPMPLTWSSYLWATPGRDEVQDYTVAVITDIVERYDVEGVHLDFIRYAGEQYSYDPASNDAGGDTKSPERDQWQRDRVTSLVQRVSDESKAIRPDLLISAAVWPYYTDEWGWYGVEDSEGYDDLYQDSKGWLANGTLDAIAPMLYGGHADDVDRWKILMDDFLQDSAGGHVYPGIGGFNQINPDASFEEIAERIQATRDAGAPGHAIFSYGTLNWADFWDELAAGPYAVPATIPSNP